MGVDGKIISAINKAKEKVFITSSQIDKTCADLLIKKALEGVRVQVITSDREDNEGGSLASMAERYREDELRRAEEEAAELRTKWKSAYLKNMIIIISAAALIIAGISISPFLILAAIGVFAAYGYYTIASESSLLKIERRLAAAEEGLKKTAESVRADREKLKAYLSALTAPMVHIELYIVDGRAWARSSSRNELVEIDVEMAEEKFMELWAKLSPP